MKKAVLASGCLCEQKTLAFVWQCRTGAIHFIKCYMMPKLDKAPILQVHGQVEHRFTLERTFSKNKLEKCLIMLRIPAYYPQQSNTAVAESSNSMAYTKVYPLYLSRWLSTKIWSENACPVKILFYFVSSCFHQKEDLDQQTRQKWSEKTWFCWKGNKTCERNITSHSRTKLRAPIYLPYLQRN